MHLNGSTGVLEERNIGSAWGKGHKVIFSILTVSLQGEIYGRDRNSRKL